MAQWGRAQLQELLRSWLVHLKLLQSLVASPWAPPHLPFFLQQKACQLALYQCGHPCLPSLQLRTLPLACLSQERLAYPWKGTLLLPHSVAQPLHCSSHLLLLMGLLQQLASLQVVEEEILLVWEGQSLQASLGELVACHQAHQASEDQLRAWKAWLRG